MGIHRLSWGLRLLAAALVAVLAAAPVGAGAEVPTPGVEYSGGTRIEVPALGASFRIPEGWIGGIVPGQSSFMIASHTRPGAIFVMVERMSLAQAKAQMSQAQPLGDGLVLVPRSAPRAAGKAVLVGDYGVQGAAEPAAGYARVVVGGAGVAVIVVGVTSVEAIGGLRPTVDALSKTVKVSTPKAPKPSSGAASGPWAKSLAGKQLIRFSHGSGYSEKEVFTLCPDGRFFRGFDASSVSQLGTGAAASGGAGRWSASGPATGGTITLTWANGQVSQHRVWLQGDALMVDGSRWLRQQAPPCP